MQILNHFLSATLIFQAFIQKRKDASARKPLYFDISPRLRVLHLGCLDAGCLTTLSLECLFSHYAIRGEKAIKRHKPCL